MKTNVAVIYGGRTGEHEVSHRSAKSVIDAIDTEKYKVLHYVISKEGKWSPRPILPEPGGNPGIDVVFPVLHGTFGEDGTMQGLLELADLPYVGAGVLASSISMDKEMMKRVAKERGLPVVEYAVVPCSGGWINLDFDYPVFVKPANLGSSVGISKARNSEELKAAMELASAYDRKVIVERGITGRELECAVLGNESLRDSAIARVLRLRRQISFGSGEDRDSGGSFVRTDGRDAEAGRGMLSGCRVRGHGACRLFARKRHRQAVYQRDQHHPRIHVNKHVP